MSAIAHSDPLRAGVAGRCPTPRAGYWAGKVVLVTGGSSGLGRALAEVVCPGRGRRGGFRPLGRRLGNRRRRSLRPLGTRVLAIPADVTQQDQVEQLIEQTIQHFGRLDVLVNNVGRSTRGALLDATPEDFANLMEINFLSVVRCTRAAVPHLIRSRGHLVNIGSLSGKSASRYVGRLFRHQVRPGCLHPAIADGACDRRGST